MSTRTDQHQRGRGSCAPIGAWLVLGLAAACTVEPHTETRSTPLSSWLDSELSIPSDTELRAQLADAIELHRRENFDQVLDALDPGELLEHATLTQIALDRGIFGLEEMFAIGDELFGYEFRAEDGLGNDLSGDEGVLSGDGPAPNLRRVHRGEFGGPDAHSCASCHSKGGPDGAGTNTQNAFFRGDGDSTLGADERSAPHVLGLGPIEALAKEMTADLQGARDAAIAEAADTGATVERALSSKGVSFGIIRADPDGSLDLSGIEGVDPDLVIKPFGWKGHQATIRATAEEAFRVHMGIVSMHEQELVRDGLVDPANYGDGVWFDVDGDGAALEIEDGMLTTIVVYLSQLEVPIIRPPQTEDLLDRFATGQYLFDEVGCADCHRPMLELMDTVIATKPEQLDYLDRPAVEIDVARDGRRPKIEPQTPDAYAFDVRLFSDLKRHDMGPELATPVEHAGVPPSVFLTRPLWGLAETAPYLHDGRAPTIHDAIRLHGGKASDSRDQYLALNAEDRGSLLVFLLSLSRAPKLLIP